MLWIRAPLATYQVQFGVILRALELTVYLFARMVLLSPLTPSRLADAGAEGHWLPLGFEESFRTKGWYEVNDIPLPEVFRFLEDLFNEGEPYEKIPLFIAHVILPLSMALLLLRFGPAG